MENTKISNAILSRFDLIFLMVDKPDPERDKKLSEHIMNLHNQNRKRPNKIAANMVTMTALSNHSSLNEQYVRNAEVYGKTYSLEQIRKYLAYIKTTVHPTLSREAADIIKSFYLMLRESSPTNSFQITTRQLDSLVRLAMARARIECREIVREEDAYVQTNIYLVSNPVNARKLIRLLRRNGL